MRVYLSGGMEHARHQGAAWRSSLEKWIRKELHHKVFNPARVSQEFLRKYYPRVDQKKLKKKDPKRYSEIVSRLIEIDCREIARRSDYLICFWDESAQKGAGTKGELTMAKYFRKPVYMVTKMSLAEIPGWILGCTTKIFSSFDELKIFLKNEFGER